MTQKFKKVPVRGMTAEEVVALWLEGRLYTEAKKTSESDRETLARCQREALEYAQRVDVFATPEWRPYINMVWERIVEADSFALGLVMKQKRQLNRYFITGVVFNLQTLGVYRPPQDVSQLRLHLTLEEVKQKNSIFKNWGQYAINGAQRKCLQALLKDLSTSLK